MRVFAVPNGSGKTTITRQVQQMEIHLGVYVNADDIESELHTKSKLPFESFELEVSETALQEFVRVHGFSAEKRNEFELWNKLKVVDNALQVDTHVDAYLAADVAEFIRNQLLATGASFTYETVMSHPSKLDFLQKARDEGYRVYLYYIATEDFRINIRNVNLRITQHGHAVAPEKVEQRYYKSLQQLKEAVKLTNVLTSLIAPVLQVL